MPYRPRRPKRVSLHRVAYRTRPPPAPQRDGPGRYLFAPPRAAAPRAPAPKAAGLGLSSWWVQVASGRRGDGSPAVDGSVLAAAGGCGTWRRPPEASVAFGQSSPPAVAALRSVNGRLCEVKKAATRPVRRCVRTGRAV